MLMSYLRRRRVCSLESVGRERETRNDALTRGFAAGYREGNSQRSFPMDWREHIEQNPEVMLGKPVIRGTRLTVELILESLSQGAAEKDLLEAHPRLRPEHIRAALAFAAASLSSELTILAGREAE